MPVFSVIVPVFNVEPYLRECLDSIRRQTFPDWESICVDDGSTDGSGAILDEYAALDPRFHVIHQTNVGAGLARNSALNLISGQLVLFLDGDDVLSDELMLSVKMVADNHPNINLFCFSLGSFTETPPFSIACPSSWVKINISKEVTYEVLHSYFCQFAYRRSAVSAHAFPRYQRGEDRIFLAKVLLAQSFIFKSTMIGYGYRSRMGSAVHSEPTQQVILDEMDHRVDLAKLIGGSSKTADDAFRRWLIQYFTETIPLLFSRRRNMDHKLISTWKARAALLCKIPWIAKTRPRILQLIAKAGDRNVVMFSIALKTRIMASIRYRANRARQCIPRFLYTTSNK